MAITDTPLDAAMLELVEANAAEGAAMAGIRVRATPLRIVTAINDFVYAEQGRPTAGIDNWEQRALPLGSLWGNQLVREFGWEWTTVAFHDPANTRTMGVVSADRSLATYPFDFVFACLEGGTTVTILLAFNMLVAGRIPPQPVGGYVNIMDGVRHIVPPP